MPFRASSHRGAPIPPVVLPLHGTVVGRDYLPEASPGTEVRVDTLTLRHSAIMTSSNGTIFRVTGPLCWEFTGHRWIPRTKASDAELWCFLWYVWINGRVNTREAGDLRRHRAHYVITVMPSSNNTNIDTDREMCKIQRYGYIKNSAWVTVNNDFFGSRVRRFANNFHEWRSHEWKPLANRITSDPKIVSHGNECIILFLTCYLMFWTHNFAETIIDRWFRHCR